ncbi:hypothetical protein Tco_0363611 [Tanacetum coccineum]
MNPQETQQVAARDEKWVLSAERVKISSTNIRLETTVPQKEEKFQMIIDVINNSTCFKAFTISADVPEIFMQQFWTILDICPRVEGVDFTDVPDDETALTFLIELGYKGLLNRHTNMFVDHMHQPWRTLAAIINKENVDYPELIWEDFAYQIDHRKEKRSRRKKTAEESQETIDVSEESEPELELAKKKTYSKRKVKKKVTLSADDNIISDDPDAAFELAKSISKTKAEEEEAARKVCYTP